MRIIPISDLHVDFLRANKHSDLRPHMYSAEWIRGHFQSILNKDDVNVICVAGDIAERMKGVVWALRAATALLRLQTLM